MFDESQLNQMSARERAELARALARLDEPVPLAAARAQRRRLAVIAAAVTGAVVLSFWIAVLAMTLPRYYRSGGWRLTWIGFDIGLLLVLAVTAWAAWRRRQVLIVSLVVLATLLTCDAWFDATLDWRTPGFMVSLVLALAVELPVAVLSVIGARRLMRLTIGRLEHLDGGAGAVPPFWKVPLFGDSSVGYRHLWTQPRSTSAATSESPPP